MNENICNDSELNKLRIFAIHIVSRWILPKKEGSDEKFLKIWGNLRNYVMTQLMKFWEGKTKKKHPFGNLSFFFFNVHSFEIKFSCTVLHTILHPFIQIWTQLGENGQLRILIPYKSNFSCFSNFCVIRNPSMSWNNFFVGFH